MSFANKSMLLIAAFIFIFLASVLAGGNCSKNKKKRKMLQLTDYAPKKKLLSKDMLQFFGDFLEPDSAQKMTETSKQWRDIKMYDNIFPNESEVAVLKNVNTEEIIWESIKFTKLWKPLSNQERLVSYLRQNDSTIWSDVFVWFVDNTFRLNHNKKSQNEPFLKELVFAIAENVSVSLAARYGRSPLMVAAAFDDKDSILALIKRGADVNQQDIDGSTALHHATEFVNINACETLLDNNANIDASNYYGWTPLMYAAIFGNKSVYKFLIEKGADETRINNSGRTASQLAGFQKR